MGLDITIRRATHEDVEAIVELAAKVELDEADESQGTTNGFLVSGYDRNTYARQIENADHFYVACTGSKAANETTVAGFVLAYSENRIGKDEELNQKLKAMLSRFVVIKQIAVDPAIGRQGIAGRLYEQVRKRLGGTGRTQLVAAVVDDPPNEVSTRFHYKQGFSPMVELIGPDGKPRTVWRSSTVPGNDGLLNQQYERAIQLYLHEDSLNWEKLRNYVYITVALMAGAGLILESGLGRPESIETPRYVLALGICLIGILISFGYSVALYSGIRFLRSHKESVTRLEDQYVRHGGIRLLPYQSLPVSVAGRVAPTSYLLQYTPAIGLVVWLTAVIFILSQLAAPR